MRFTFFSGINGMELIWAVLTIVSLLLGIYGTFMDGIAQSYPLFIISAISGMMYMIRKTMRKKEQENDE